MNDTGSELFLSSVLGKDVINSRGYEIGKLYDLVMVSGERYPEVSHLVVQARKDLYRVSWQRIALFNRYAVTVSGSVRQLPDFHPEEGEILLKRDILDKQIVDVNGAKVVRVNDLKLGSYHKRLCVFFVDVGFRGLLRRMGWEWAAEKVAALLRTHLPQRHIKWQYVQLLEPHISHLTLTVAREQLKELHPADLAEILSNLHSKNIIALLDALDLETAGEAIHELEPEFRSRVIREMEVDRASGILSEMARDEAADVLGDLPEEKAQELLGLMDEKESGEIQELMEHEEDTAGGLMNTDFISIPSDADVAQALGEVRRMALEVDIINYIYVLGREEVLEGVVSLRELLVSPPQGRIRDLMNTNLKFVQVDSTPQEVIEMVAKYNFVAVPVLDDGGHMQGIVSVDDVLEVFVPAVTGRRRHRNG